MSEVWKKLTSAEFTIGSNPYFTYTSRVPLTTEERREIEGMVHAGKCPCDLCIGRGVKVSDKDVRTAIENDMKNSCDCSEKRKICMHNSVNELVGKTVPATLTFEGEMRPTRYEIEDECCCSCKACEGCVLYQRANDDKVLSDIEKQFTEEKDLKPKSVLPLVIKDLIERGEKGEQEYGVPLRTYNGRDALRDAYEEALDLSQYLRQAYEEALDRVMGLKRVMEAKRKNDTV